VVYNASAEGSRELAELYAEYRQIPDDRLVALECPVDESIDRETFDETIAEPLRAIFREREWWMTRAIDEGAERVVETKVHVLALMRGIPLRVQGKSAGPATEGVSLQTGPPDATAASVDSELALLGDPPAALGGWVRNPCFRSHLTAPGLGIPWLLFVGRVDGPSDEVARRVVRDAVETEPLGLWGKVYVDLAQKGPGYEQADGWLGAVAERSWREGMSVVLDPNPDTFPNFYPMSDAAVYFGWYTGNVNGPFRNPEFRFRKGAVACHLHSFSATTLRNANQRWTAPLLARGAAAALGNVYEPFLHGTTWLDVFYERLLEGMTVVEAAWLATPYLSWTNIVVGDPLYRPFAAQSQGAEPPQDPSYRIFVAHRQGLQRWAGEPEKLAENFERAGENLDTGYFEESLALLARNRRDYPSAARYLEAAEKGWRQPRDRLRARLLVADLHRETGNTEKAVALLRESAEEFAKIPEGRSITALLNLLDPPPPDAPDSKALEEE
jgi:uncharacterized protein (TIGR03790 family)